MATTQTTRTTVSSRIRQQLLERITRGELAPGSRLPSERALSDEFEAACTSVREAISGLVLLGVVERRGDRTWVADHLPSLLADGSPDVARFARNLCEARRVLEVPVCSLAATRADGAARDEVERILASSTRR